MKQLILVLICHISLSINAQNVGIGITTPHSSSILDVNSNNKGMLAPRMSSAQRAAIASPAKGLLVFDTDTNTFWFHNGSSWEQMIAAGGGGLTLPYNGSISNPGVAFRVGNTGTGIAIEGSSVSGSGVYANSFSGAALNAYSTNGAGIITTSNSNSAIIASTSGTNPAVVINSTGQNLTEALRVNGYINGIKVTTSSVAGNGIYSETSRGAAIMARTTNEQLNDGYGLWAISAAGTAVLAQTTTGTALRVHAPVDGLALDISGAMKIQGTPNYPYGEGKVLTSDGFGYANWKSLPLTNKVGFNITGNIGGGAEVFPQNSWYRMHFANKAYDPTVSYAMSTVASSPSSFLVPYNGFYCLQALVTFDGAINPTTDNFYSALRFQLKRGGVVSTLQTKVFHTRSGCDDHSIDLNYNTYLQAGDQVYVEAFGIPGDLNSYIRINTAADKNHFSGYLIHQD